MSAAETINTRYAGLDTWDDVAILDAFWEGQARAVAAVRAAHPAIAEAARGMVARLGETGRIVYAGAGSSGLIAALDGMELAGTFGWPDTRTAFLLANGRVLEPGMAGGAEDDTDLARSQLAALAPTAADAVIAVAASGKTPYTVEIVARAREAGALTIAMAGNADAPLLAAAEIPILLDTGPELPVGSTRMNAGTAQKAALGLLSNLVMLRLGYVYDGLMVNFRVDNAKLRRRALMTIMYVAECGEEAAAIALDRAGGKVKNAILVASGASPMDAERMLADAKGNLREAIAALG